MFESGGIRGIVFDLDGTLVETEHLKARAYAALIVQLTGRESVSDEVIELYRSVVGSTDLAVCAVMIDTFRLEPALQPSEGETPARLFHEKRMQVYRERFGTPSDLARVQYAHNVELAHAAHGEGLAVGVATMSFAAEAERVIGAIGLADVVQTIVGADDVERPKPAPDAFLMAMDRLGLTGSDTLIIEDTPRGANAAAASGARWLCVATEFSTKALRADPGVDPDWIVWDPANLAEAVARRIAS